MAEEDTNEPRIGECKLPALGTPQDLVPAMALQARRSPRCGSRELPSGVQNIKSHIEEIEEIATSAVQNIKSHIEKIEEIATSSVQNIKSHIEEIEEPVSNFKQELSRQVQIVGVHAEMIYRVPQSIRSFGKDAYAPLFVSLGPYHCGNPEAPRLADKYKWSFAQQILNINKEVSLQMYWKEMNRVMQEVKGCYEEDIQIEINDGIKMFLLDGCFILGFLGILPLPQQQYDPTIIPLWRHDSIIHDLLLMENQLPFFVLQKIFDLATAGTAVAEPHSLKEKVDKAIKKLLQNYPLITKELSFHHLLHCCHRMFRPAMFDSSSSKSLPTGELDRKWCSATDLHKAGIKIKPILSNRSNELSLLDVQLISERILMIPVLIIEDCTRSIFWNLIAFEQTSGAREKYFAAYAFFMGQLMGTPEDVDLLIKKGVVKNYIGANKKVSDFFNNLGKEVKFDPKEKHYLSSTIKELNSYYNKVGNKYIADLKQNYCGSPWLVISVVAAAVMLIGTIVQSVFAVIKK